MRDSIFVVVVVVVILEELPGIAFREILAENSFLFPGIDFDIKTTIMYYRIGLWNI